MPTIMVILNFLLSAGVVLGIVGLCAWGVVTDRPFATALHGWAMARAGARDRRHVPRESGPAHSHGRLIDI